MLLGRIYSQKGRLYDAKEAMKWFKEAATPKGMKQPDDPNGIEH